MQMVSVFFFMAAMLKQRRELQNMKGCARIAPVHPAGMDIFRSMYDFFPEHRGAAA
jgi:hypothetical protein